MGEESLERTVSRIQGALEQALPAFMERQKSMEDKLDRVLEHKADKADIAKVDSRVTELDRVVQAKADKKDVTEIQKRIWMWAGGGTVVLAILSWLVPKFFEVAR